MFLSSKHSVSIADVYCDEPLDGVRADVIRYNYWSTLPPGLPLPGRHTNALSLTRSVEDLLAGLDPETRHKIRRSSKDDLSMEAYRDAAALQQLETFCDFHDAATRDMALPPLDRAWLRAMASAGALELSCSKRAGHALVWHAFYRDARNALLLYTDSDYRRAADSAARNVIGRANRSLWWEDIQRFRAAGALRLDFGGWYVGGSDPHLLRINAFKQEFGGAVQEVYHSLHGVTVKGKLAERYLAWKLRRRSAAPSVAAPAPGA